MKKAIIVFTIIIITLIVILSISLVENNKNIMKVKNYNKEYEDCFQKTVFGTDVTTVINRATNENIRNNIEIDENGYFIENDINSIKIEIKLLYDKKLTSYQMEQLTKVGLIGFVENFNLINFKCVSIEYHESTKRVKKVVFEQIEE